MAPPQTRDRDVDPKAYVVQAINTLEDSLYSLAIEYLKNHFLPEDVTQKHRKMVLDTTRYLKGQSSYRPYLESLKRAESVHVLDQAKYGSLEAILENAIRAAFPQTGAEGSPDEMSQEKEEEETQALPGSFALASELYETYKEIYNKVVFRDLFLIFYGVHKEGSAEDTLEELTLGPRQDRESPYMHKENYGWPDSVPAFIAKRLGDQFTFLREHPDPESAAHAVLQDTSTWDSPYFVQRYGFNSLMAALSRVAGAYTKSDISVQMDTALAALYVLASGASNNADSMAKVYALLTLRQKDPEFNPESDPTALSHETTMWEKLLSRDRQALSIPPNTQKMFGLVYQTAKQTHSPAKEAKAFRLVRTTATQLRLYEFIHKGSSR